jgi:1-acyl-sn-glycerol-3-phosphate acyltransferase
MSRILAWALLPLYLFLEIATLCIWDVLLKILRPIHAGLHKFVLDTGVHLLLIHLRVLGTRITVTFETPLPTQTTLIVISNHQSVFDIPLLMWYLRRTSPIFVAKKELEKWIPSVSCTLRTNGSVLIDRADAAQAVTEIRRLGDFINEKKIAACIFPEGTRSRDGVVKRFKSAGVRALLEQCPEATVVPVAISGAWQLVQHKFFPVPVGVRVYLDVLSPLARTGKSAEDLLTIAEKQISARVSAHS